MSEDTAFPPSPRRSRQGAGSFSETEGQQPGVIVNDTTTQPRRDSRSGSNFSPWKALSSVFSVAMIVATLFTLFMPDNLFSNDLLERMFQAVQPVELPQDLPTLTPSPRQRIGLVAGHSGNDPGAVCADGLTEESVNLKIASLVQKILTDEGYQVDLLLEFDQRLTDYRSIALVSIHNDSCDYINDQATGFKVAAAASSMYPEKATRLTACMSQRYQSITGMSYHYNTVTTDMTAYHAFGEINPDTTAAIIETGFLNLDREILTTRTDVVAQGVASGILCFVRNEDIPQQVPTTMP